MKKDRLLIYIVINILVSALTTLGVLIVWDMTHQIQNGASPLQTAGSPTRPQSFSSTLPPTSQAVLQINNVYGVGHIEDEVVVIQRLGEGEMSLSGWKLVDGHNHQFIFPQLTLNAGLLNVYSRSGTNTAKDLYWNQAHAVWQTGEKVQIYDPLGNLRAEYNIP